MSTNDNPPTIIAPIIHGNGTSAARLIEVLSDAYCRLDEAYTALRQCAPNGRDYYPKPGLLEKAQEQHMKRLGAVAGVMESLEAEMAAIEDQGK